MANLIRQETIELEAARLEAVRSGNWKPYIALLESFGQRKAPQELCDLKATLINSITINKR